MWPRCKTCKHVAECHESPGKKNSRNTACEGDNPGDTCDCQDYELPDNWKYDESGEPVRK